MCSNIMHFWYRMISEISARVSVMGWDSYGPKTDSIVITWNQRHNLRTIKKSCPSDSLLWLHWWSFYMNVICSYVQQLHRSKHQMCSQGTTSMSAWTRFIILCMMSDCYFNLYHMCFWSVCVGCWRGPKQTFQGEATLHIHWASCWCLGFVLV